jgi:hypothetical protein
MNSKAWEVAMQATYALEVEGDKAKARGLAQKALSLLGEARDAGKVDGDAVVAIGNYIRKVEIKAGA